MDSTYFCHSSIGTLLYDPGVGTRHFEPWWALMLCDESIIDYYAWLLLRRGIDLERGSRWGAHVCFVRGEEPADPSHWGANPGQVTFWYANEVRWDNGRHVWLDVWCPTLADIRDRLGLRVKQKTLFHLTLGRLTKERPSDNKGYDYGDYLIL
jgi:hypothetical protein